MALSSSIWTEKAQAVQGTYRIEVITKGDRVVSRTLRFGADFKTKSGPDLKVVLSPMEASKVASKTALKGSFTLGSLESAKGACAYEIPAEVDLSRYHAVLIHCQKYTKLWGSAALSEGEVMDSGSTWVKKSNKIRGHSELVQTSKAPDLKVILSPLALAHATNDNAMKGGIVVANLKAVKGGQEFLLPKGITLKGSQSILIHCQQYTKLWGGATLKKRDHS